MVLILDEQDLIDLRWAHKHLEHPSLAARLSNSIGTPVEFGMKLLPKRWYEKLHSALEASIQQALNLAVESMERTSTSQPDDNLHKLLVMGSGALGGFFGPLALLAELPLTTSLMLRSIADIAHSEGEDLNLLSSRLACMEVFALGGRSKQDTAADTGYYGLRISLGMHFSAFQAASGTSIPAGIELVRAIASRFGVVVSNKAAAQMIPLAGAVSGATLNLIFMQHFQDVARGHFMLRRMEREYGSQNVRLAYEQLSLEETKATMEYSTLEGW